MEFSVTLDIKDKEEVEEEEVEEAKVRSHKLCHHQTMLMEFIIMFGIRIINILSRTTDTVTENIGAQENEREA